MEAVTVVRVVVAKATAAIGRAQPANHPAVAEGTIRRRNNSRTEDTIISKKIQ
jgi:hypothetical protein